MNRDSKLIFISWTDDCSRSDSIAARLGGESHMVYSPEWGSRFLTIAFKYLSQTFKTLRILMRERPATVFVMTPPVAACLPVWMYCAVTRCRYFIDAHTGALLYSAWAKVPFIHRFFSRRAVATFVTNEHLRDMLASWNAPVLLVPDVPVVFPEPQPYRVKAGVNMVFVSTFTVDEPLELFLEAAARVPDVHFFVTGNDKKLDPDLRAKTPPNVSYTGFIAAEDYVGLLLAADAVISLTRGDHTMQRGAYEAAYLGRPIVTSDFGVLRQFFDKGTVHVGNDVESIATGLQEMRDNLARFAEEVQDLKQDKLDRWDRVVTEIKRAIAAS
jgi:glycosyltransferase involved in cell wall biosynthesis